MFCHPETGRPYDASRSRVRFKAALKRASLRELRFHDLGHTYGTSMAAAGTPLRTLQGWMGHRDWYERVGGADRVPISIPFGVYRSKSRHDETWLLPLHGMQRPWPRPPRCSDELSGRPPSHKL